MSEATKLNAHICEVKLTQEEVDLLMQLLGPASGDVAYDVYKALLPFESPANPRPYVVQEAS